MSPSLTPAEAKMLGRRAAQPVRMPGELLAVFVAGKLVNTKNARLHHMAEYRYKNGWLERTALALLIDAGWKPTDQPHFRSLRISFLCNVARLMDEQDGLRIACAPVLDALGMCGVLTGKIEKAGRGDEPHRGHEIIYAQQINRAQRGVTIRVSLRRAEGACP